MVANLALYQKYDLAVLSSTGNINYFLNIYYLYQFIGILYFLTQKITKDRNYNNFFIRH